MASPSVRWQPWCEDRCLRTPEQADPAHLGSSDPGCRMTGAELRAARQALGLTQTGLADKAGIGRHAVSYWEGKAWVEPRGHAPRRMLQVLGLLGELHSGTLSRAGGGVLLSADAEFEQKLARDAVRHETKRTAQARQCVVCGACTRKGQPCRMLSEPGRRRCKFHGGKSTGPRTPGGRARIAEAQQQRWAAWRAAKTAGERG